MSDPPLRLPTLLKDPAHLMVLVTGGRTYRERNELRDALTEVEVLRRNLYPNVELVIVQGGADGADGLARDWAWDHRVRLITEPANWMRHGRAAGVRRNQAMLDKYRPDLCIATPGGRGTADMVERCRQASVPVYFLETRRPPGGGFLLSRFGSFFLRMSQTMGMSAK